MHKRVGEGGEAKSPGCVFSGSGPRNPVPHLRCVGLCLQDHSAGSMGQRSLLWMQLSSCASESCAEWGFLRGPLHLLVPDWLLQPRNAALQHSSPSVKGAHKETALVAVMWPVNRKLYKRIGESVWHGQGRRATDSRQHDKPPFPSFMLLFCLKNQDKEDCSKAGETDWTQFSFQN